MSSFKHESRISATIVWCQINPELVMATQKCHRHCWMAKSTIGVKSFFPGWSVRGILLQQALYKQAHHGRNKA